MRDYLLVYINGRRHEIRGADAFQPVSTFLRETLRLVGTKIVCSEGDCGSCTVLVGGVAVDSIQYKPVCSCIATLAQVDCMHMISVEGLKYDGKLNPVQESMVRNQGSQCGFCTPGFIVSMCAVLDEHPAASREQMQRGLVGNLCRCTGYQSILGAGQDVHRQAMRPLAGLFDTAAIAAELAGHAGQSVEIAAGELRLFIPATLDEALAVRKAHPDALIWSGGTDLGVQVNKGFRQLGKLLCLRGISELHGVVATHAAIMAGACATIGELEAAAREHLPEYGRMLGWFGSPPIKNAGTVGGNIANGSPIADTMPGMYVLNGEIELAGAGGTRRVNINSFYTGYKKTVMAADELIVRVYIPLPKPGEIFKVYKISRRKDLDISAFTAAFWMRQSAGVIDDIRIAYGGVGANILRLPKTEAFLRGAAISEELFGQAGELARTEITPISDVRGSADFRLQLSQNILLKFYNDLESGSATEAAGRTV